MSTPPRGITRHPYPLAARVLTVVRVEELSVDMRRIVLGGDDLEATLPFGAFSPTDHVKLAIPHPGTGEVVLPSFGDQGMVRPEDVVLREYTIRHFDAERRELAIDFVLHQHGPAGRWASTARPGDKLGVMGPRGSAAYPDDYQRYLLVADETALAPLERWLEEAPAEARLDAFVLVEDPSRERALPTRPGLQLTWLHRAAGDDLAVAAIAAMPTLEPDTFVWAAAEASGLVALRRHLRALGHHRAATDVRGYWKLGEAEHHEGPDSAEGDAHGE